MIPDSSLFKLKLLLEIDPKSKCPVLKKAAPQRTQDTTIALFCFELHLLGEGESIKAHYVTEFSQKSGNFSDD